MSESPLQSVKKWVLIEGSRRKLTLVLLVSVYMSLIGVYMIWPYDLTDLLTKTDTVQTLFNTLLSGVILLISIVVSISSLGVSQELAALPDQQRRVVKSWEFRSDTAELAGVAATPAKPADFLETVLETVEERLDNLAEAAEEKGKKSEAFAAEEASDRIADVREGIQSAAAVLEDPEGKRIDTTVFGPQIDVSEYIDTVRTIKIQDEEGGDEKDLKAEIDSVVEVLQLFTTAQEYFKTVFYKREFSQLSRDLLYSGLPAILLISYVLLALKANYLGWQVFGVVPALVLFISFAYTIALAPFIILTAYTIRAAVIAEETMSTSAFIFE